jgi:hypothetical protein
VTTRTQSVIDTPMCRSAYPIEPGIWARVMVSRRATGPGPEGTDILRFCCVVGSLRADSQFMESRELTGNQMGAISLGLTPAAWLLVLLLLEVDVLNFVALYLLAGACFVAGFGITRSIDRHTSKWLAILALVTAVATAFFWIRTIATIFSRF